MFGGAEGFGFLADEASVVVEVVGDGVVDVGDAVSVAVAVVADRFDVAATTAARGTFDGAEFLAVVLVGVVVVAALAVLFLG